MTSAALADALETLADGPPWDTAWLRTLLPELAVRGRLVAQEEADREFPTWEEQTSTASIRLRTAGFGTPKRAPEPKFDGDLPSGWRWSTMANVGLIVGGGTPKSGEPAYWAEQGQGVPWVTPADLDDPGPVEIKAGRRDVSDEGLNNSSARLLPAGTVLFSSRAPIGKVAIAANPLATNQGFKSCVPYVSDAGPYIYLWLLVARAGIEASATGTTFKEVSGKDFGKVPIALPPLAEQHRIVAKVDELMGYAKVLEERHLAASSARVRLRDAALHALAEAEDHAAVATAWARIEEHFEDLFTEPEDIQPLRQTILQLAVRGRLVGPLAGDGTGQTLAAEIRKHRQSLADRHQLRPRTPVSPSSNEKMASQSAMVATWSRVLPKHWACLRLEEITHPVRVISYGILKPGPDVPGGVPYIKVRDIQRGVIETAHVKRTTRQIHSQYSRTELVEGDLLLSIRGTVGKVATVPAALAGGNITQDTARIAVLSPMSTAFVELCLRSNDLQGLFAAESKGAAVQGLNIGSLRPTPMPIPPLAEQRRIVAKVDELMALCDTLEASLTRAKACREQFATSISAALNADPPDTPDRDAA